MTLERWYHRAAVLIWPEGSRFDVLCEAGMQSAVGGLEQMVRPWKQAKQGGQETLRQQCLTFASRIISHWPELPFASGIPVDPRFEVYDYGQDEEDFKDEDQEEEDELGGRDWEDYEEEDEEGGDEDEDEEGGAQEDHAAPQASPRPLLALLEELGGASLIAAWIRGVLAKDVTVDPGKTLGDVCGRDGWATFRNELRELFERTSNETLERHARLLADWSLRKDRNSDRTALCSELAEQIMSVVERWDPTGARRDWRARRVKRAELLPPLAQAFLALEAPELLDRLVSYVLGRPKEFDLTTVQMPALLALEAWLKRNVKRPSLPLHRWLTAVCEELESRKSHPPQAPVDWRRASATGCNCTDCKELARFLKDPSAQTLRLPLAEMRRRHLHNIIDGKKLDTTHETERKGRPYTLVCTKTKASYERALQAHRIDLDHLAKIRTLLAWHEGL
jgi:hypothetical protein